MDEPEEDEELLKQLEEHARLQIQLDSLVHNEAKPIFSASNATGRIVSGEATVPY